LQSVRWVSTLFHIWKSFRSLIFRTFCCGHGVADDRWRIL